MTALVLAEHDNVALKAATLNAISAALKIDQDVHVLVVGAGCKAVADAAAATAFYRERLGLAPGRGRDPP